MKKIRKSLFSQFQIFVIAMVVCINYASGQNLWKEIEHPLTVEVYPIFCTKNDYWIGRTDSGSELFISKDKGNKWDLLFLNFSGSVPQSGDLVDGPDDKLYLTTPDANFEIDCSNYSVVDLKNYNYIYSILINNDSEKFFATYNSISKYDENKQLLAKLDLNLYKAKILRSKSNRYYCFYTDLEGSKFIEFNKDLKILNGPQITPFNGPYSFAINNERIFVTDQLSIHFSDDGGVTWNQTERKGEVLPVNDSTVVVLNYDGYNYISKNNGTDFSSEIIGTTISIFSVDSQGKLIARDNSCSRNISDPYYLLSNDLWMNWDTIKATKNIPSSFVITAGIAENNLMVSTYKNCYQLLRIKNGQEWNEVNLNDVFYAFTHFANGRIIGQNAYSIISSDDNGLSWQTSLYDANGSFSYTQVIDEKIVLLKTDSICSSLDTGLTWKCEFLDYAKSFGKPKYSIFDRLVFFNNGSFIAYDSFYQLALYDNVKKIKVPLVLNNAIYTFISTYYFSKTGKIIIQNPINSSYSELNVSSDFGKTFSVTRIDKSSGYLIIDAFDNLYLINSKKLILSSDLGKSWNDITPYSQLQGYNHINDVSVSPDKYIYLSVYGLGILKSPFKVAENKVVNLKAFLDKDENCFYNQMESILSNVKFIIDDSIVVIPQTLGFDLALRKGPHKIKIEYDKTLFIACSDEFIFEVGKSNEDSEILVGLKPLNYCSDLSYSIASPYLRRCFDNTYFGTICNNGNVEIKDFEMILIVDEHFDYKNSNLNFVKQVEDKLYFSFDNLAIGSCVDFHINFNLLCTAVLGQEHCVEFRGPFNNNCEESDPYINCQTNKGSFDPNDKAIFVNGFKDKETCDLEDEIEYMIRFQNTGTDTAFNIFITDTISDNFDIKSIRPISSSHYYNWQIIDRVLRVDFRNINLVDSFANEPKSNGFILFKLKLKAGITYGEKLENKGAIYFDFNEPVITNTVQTIVQKPLSTYIETKVSFEIYPNPTSNFVNSNLLIGEKLNQISIYNSIGQFISKSEKLPFDTILLSDGIYMMHFQSNMRNIISRFTVMK